MSELRPSVRRRLRDVLRAAARVDVQTNARDRAIRLAHSEGCSVEELAYAASLDPRDVRTILHTAQAVDSAVTDEAPERL